MGITKEIQILSPLVEALKKAKELGEKQEILLAFPRVQKALTKDFFSYPVRQCENLSSKNALFGLAAIGQETTLLPNEIEEFPRKKVIRFLGSLTAIDRFYESIGGIVGYQHTVLNFLEDKQKSGLGGSVLAAKPIDITQDTETVKKAVILGLKSLVEMGEIYPIGGLGTRLNLKSKKGKDLPVASLIFCGKSLLEGLIRDLQAREFCYFRLFGKQVTTPVGLMTSKENQNDEEIKALCKKRKWFGRPQEAFFLFSQISVPVVTKDGNWCLKAPLELCVQPGGHGALWRTAEQAGVFSWFFGQERHRLLIRQINNPLAGVDSGLSALVGFGRAEHKTFGFASCPKLEGAAEGALVLIEEAGRKRLSNIEYPDFKKFELDKRLKEESFFANTNILYADLSRLFYTIKKAPLPGLILNMKNKVSYQSSEGKKLENVGGRLESMMQNISDILQAKKNASLPTFLTYNERRKTLSATKRSFEKELLETPEGAFFDLLYNNHELLEKRCHVQIDSFCSKDAYLKQGPSHLFLYHPALGPFYDTIAQKIKGGHFAKGAELVLEIADALLENVQLSGSLLVEARNVLGHTSQDIVRYSQNTGKCVLKNVQVYNKGVKLPFPLSCWKYPAKRKERLQIVLEGHSEFYAENVVFQGNQIFCVPDKERWVAKQTKTGEILIEKQKVSWTFGYKLKKNSLKLQVDLDSTSRKSS